MHFEDSSTVDDYLFEESCEDNSFVYLLLSDKNEVKTFTRSQIDGSLF